MKFAFISTMTALPWGGSEVLWAETARHLLVRGHEVFINFQHWQTPARALTELEKSGAKLHLRRKPVSLSQIRRQRIRARLGLKQKPSEDETWLERVNPDFVLVTMGYHLDWLPELEQIQSKGIPYAINLQVAYADATPEDPLWNKLSGFYQNAKRRFFLCEENRDIMRNLLGQAMKPCNVIDNPTKVQFDQQPISFPSFSDGSFRLACIARIQFASKGQDLLVEALALKHWKNRDIKITFYGEDQGNYHQLKKRIEYHGIEDKFQFAGYTPHPLTIWEQNMGLLLCSRFEGLPMVTIEAMRMGRIVITTRCGRNPEIIDDNETGFLANHATVEAIDEALQRAWAQRHQWEAMGLKANQRIQKRYSATPVEDFLELLLKTASS